MRDPRRVALIAALVLSPLVVATAPRAQAGGPPDTFHRPLDQILDVDVRDGLVYYRALRSDRGRLDRYIATLNVPAANYDGWSREHKMAFWVNAYNAIVLQTVINHYPIHGASSRYPSNSIRQIPGAFDVAKYHLAGKNVTLDEIEKSVLPPFKEPRLFLALGRGALGSGRLRSEAYAGDRIEKQLDDVQQEFVGEAAMLKIDRGAGEIAVTPIVSWREAEFVQAYDKGSSGPYAQRSPIERAVIAFITPRLFPLEKEFVQKNEFRMTFQQFDWRLNDLTGGRPQ
jgi:Protein of unknown function, DUF547